MLNLYGGVIMPSLVVVLLSLNSNHAAGSQDLAERCHSHRRCRGSNVQQPLLRVKERNTPKNGMIDVSSFVEACRWGKAANEQQ